MPQITRHLYSLSHNQSPLLSGRRILEICLPISSPWLCGLENEAPSLLTLCVLAWLAEHSKNATWLRNITTPQPSRTCCQTAHQTLRGARIYPHLQREGLVPSTLANHSTTSFCLQKQRRFTCLRPQGHSLSLV